MGGGVDCIKLGPFHLRLLLIHHRWPWTECAAAMFLGAACLGAGTATTMTTFGLDDTANIVALGLTENGQGGVPALIFAIVLAPFLIGERYCDF